MMLTEKQELVRLLNLYQVELLMINDDNIKHKYLHSSLEWVYGVKAQYEHARIISSKLAREIQDMILT